MTAIRRATLVMLVAVLVGGLAACHSGASGRPAASGPAAAASHLPTPAGVAEVRLVGPAEHGAGTAPTFQWTAVPGAVRYQLFVRDAQGGPIWAWEGTDTSVRLGGLSIDLPAGAPGPRLTPGATWLVLALGADGKVRAISEVRSANP
jgi:hypothetical protein